MLARAFSCATAPSVVPAASALGVLPGRMESSWCNGSRQCSRNSRSRRTLRSNAVSSASATLKRSLATEPVLQYSIFCKPFVPNTEATKVELGGAPMQNEDEKPIPAANAGSANSKAETNYSVTKLECLVVVSAVKLVRPNL